jgi:hypothetical protein
MTKGQAINHFGSVAGLAQALGVRVQAVYQWQQIPLLRQMQLEKLTSGQLVADCEKGGEQAA